MHLLEIETTADGSHTLYFPEMDEHYHSVNGAMQESEHVYLNAGLNHWLTENKEATKVHVLELGFGTGLNAMLTNRLAEEKQISVLYTTLEKYPLSETIYSKLNYGHSCSLLHQAAWNLPQEINPFFTLHKIEADFNDYSFPGRYDLVFYDAFAPDKQEDVWNQAIFNKLFEAMNPQGAMTTYCAKGSVRRMMQDAGFIVERIPGPPGKREMLRATKDL